MNYFVAYGRYVAYCKKAGLVKGEYYTLTEFNSLWRDGRATNHANTNYK